RLQGDWSSDVCSSDLLIDGDSGRVLWAERYDRRALDAFEVQDELVEKIVATLVGRLEQTGAETALRQRPDSLGAFDLMMRGMYQDRKSTRLNSSHLVI